MRRARPETVDTLLSSDGSTGAVPRLNPWLDPRSSPSIPAQLVIGAGAAVIAVAIRYTLPLSPIQLPTLTVVIALALVAMFVGFTAGMTTAVVGGLLAWYMFFTPFSWDLSPERGVMLIGFWVIAAVLLTASQLYRLSVRRGHETQIAVLEHKAEMADLFARELAHRLKNALAIVQSIAFQTLDPDSVETNKFAGRLKTLADAHDLLSEHVETPTARVCDVIRVALAPFAESSTKVRVSCPESRIASRQALALALALHELGTNASKHALSPLAWGGCQLKGRPRESSSSSSGRSVTGRRSSHRLRRASAPASFSGSDWAAT